MAKQSTSKPQPNENYIFISYAREDQEYVRKLVDELQRCGFETWVDNRIDYGDRWWRTIVKAIRNSSAFVVVMTPASEDSKWVEREIILAEEEGKPIFPLLLDGNCFPIFLTTQYLDVTNGQLPPDEFYERLGRLGSPPAAEYFSIGTQALIMGDLWEAKRYYKMTLEENPYYPRAEEGLARVEEELRRLSPAETAQPRSASWKQAGGIGSALLLLIIVGAITVFALKDRTNDPTASFDMLATTDALLFPTPTPEILLEDNFDSENGGEGVIDYTDFANWNVIEGSVDLIGNGYYDFFPGNGLYVDLDGSTQNAGILESRDTFVLTPGEYELEFSLAGSQMAVSELDMVKVELGTVYSEPFDRDFRESFRIIKRTIPISSSTSAKLRFEHLGGDQEGIKLDNVKLRKVSN